MTLVTLGPRASAVWPGVIEAITAARRATTIGGFTGATLQHEATLAMSTATTKLLIAAEQDLAEQEGK